MQKDTNMNYLNMRFADPYDTSTTSAVINVDNEPGRALSDTIHDQ